VSEQQGISGSLNLPTPPEKRRRPLTRKDRAAFLEALGHGWSVRHAAVHAGRHWRRFYTLRDRDETFAAEWADAVGAGTDVLEHEAFRRAVDGVTEPIYQGGELVGHVQRYSDKLLEFLLRGRRPQTYRDNAGPDVPVTIVLQSAFAAPAVQAEVIEGEARELTEGPS
jgi:hypothetical protein